jgi:hypothetical protein
MAKMENIFVNVVSEFDGKALTKGQKHLSQFDKTVQKVGKTFAAAFAVHKIVAFGQNSVKAFAAAEASAKALNITLKNTGSLMAFPDAIAGIKRLSVATGVADTALTDAFTQLYSSTGDATQAQKDLALAVDVSKGTGKNLTEVIDALSAGYRGNTKGLGNLNAGLDAAILATKDMAAITKQLAILQGGQAAAYAETYAGKIDILNVAFDNLKVTVGQGLVMAFEEATGNRGIGGATTAMENFGYTVDAVLIKLAQLSTGNFLDGLGLGFVNKVLSETVKGWNYLLGVDETRLAIQNEIWRMNTKTYEAADKQRIAQNKINDAYQKRLKLQTTQQKAALDSAKKLADAAKILDRSGTLFDIDQIQIYAALQGQITDNEKLRLDLQLALLTKNADAADLLSQQLLVSQLKTTDLDQTISSLPKALNPFADWPQYIQDLIAQMAKLTASIPMPGTSTGTSTGTSLSGTNYLYQYNSMPQSSFDPGGTVGYKPIIPNSNLFDYNLNPTTPLYGYNSMPQSTFNINIDATSMIDPANMTAVVQNALIDINKGGYSTVPAGQGF